MSIEEENDLSNILIDGDISLSSPFDLDLLSEDKPVVTRPKPILKCVVCGDNAFGKIKNFLLKLIHFFLLI